jgi:hypothetical protein
MSDANITFGADTTQAEGKLKRLKRQAQDTGKAFGAAQAGALAGRIGGQAGGMLSRVIGGGALGAGIAGAGIALNAFLETQNRTVERARARQEYLNQSSNSQYGAGVARRATEAASLSVVPTLRRLATSYARDPQGLTGARSDIQNIVSATGVTDIEAASSVIEGRNARVSGTDVARLIGTGEFSASEAAESLRQFGSPEKALAAKMRVSVGDAAIALEASGKVNTNGSIKMMEAQFENVLSGRATSAQGEIDAETLNPEQVAREAMRRSVDATKRSMEAAAAAQMSCVAALKDLAMTLGIGEGSERTKASNYRDVTKD